MVDITNIIDDRTVDIYDGNTKLAESMRALGAKHTTVFEENSAPAEKNGVTVRPLHSLLETSESVAGVCMLNDRAIKVLVAMYPSAPKFVLVRLKLHTAWLLGIVGLMRRWILRLVKIKGITTLTDLNDKRTKWLVLEQAGGIAPSIAVLPKKVGIQTFLDWLKEEKIEYVVLRFYEKLPELYREGGDIDILVSDSDKNRIEDYLKESRHLLSDYTDDVRLGLHTVFGEHGSVPYYPPRHSKQILKNAIDGPAGSRIPSKRDAFLSFIYHSLYHGKKGYVAGIPSALKERTEEYPENDYKGVILDFAKELEVPFDDSVTMEDLDEYMAQEGWRPKLDTLTKIAETNAWVRDRFFSADSSGPAGLSVFMLRQWAFDKGIAEEVLGIIESNGFIVLRKKVLSGDERKHATEHLRGGTWGKGGSDGGDESWRPAMAVVVVDLQCVNMPPAYAGGFERFRIRKLKTDLRDRFDEDGRGSVHSTDATRESWEYIEVCFPEEIDDIREEIEGYAKSSFFSKITRFLSPTYLRHSFRYSLREFFIYRFLEK